MNEPIEVKVVDLTVTVTANGEKLAEIGSKQVPDYLMDDIAVGLLHKTAHMISAAQFNIEEDGKVKGATRAPEPVKSGIISPNSVEGRLTGL